MTASSPPMIPHRPIRVARGSAIRPALLRIAPFAATILVIAGCARAADPPIAPVTAPSPAPPRAVPAPAGEAVELCVLRDGDIAVVEGMRDPETGDTLIAGRPWREVHREDAPPYAASASWYIHGEMVGIPRRAHALEKYGLTRVLRPTEVEKFGTYRGLPLFVEAGSKAEIPDVVYLFVRPGCEFQPYQQAYIVGGVRGR